MGSSDPINIDYLRKLKSLGKSVNAVWISDHLCWTGINDVNSHDLLPVPLTEENLDHISERTGCGLLLDVNNVYVSCFNAEQAPIDYFKHFPWQNVAQMYLAGHTHCGSHIIDAHDKTVSSEVWELFSLAWQKNKRCV
ncbi:DUF692 family multinuclear iron-containing protein [Pseudoalteromonas sp. NBT06-2]|uniref:multinuclear nonheme iron-dependent oxidase n=1 Tax=Pseudoalteromonas sp. NBT06-2 TaxID=2025950 RepID=UPI001140E3E9|nr:DUF692 family multinuclear iron-containing protein [Pseudoalteromonas sp. NBT06-2]